MFKIIANKAYYAKIKVNSQSTVGINFLKTNIESFAFILQQNIKNVIME